MFKKDLNMENFNEAETIIGESVFVKGNFESNGNIVINGALEGEIKTKGSVLVGEKSNINANIQAQEMFVSGNITGDLNVTAYLSLSETAQIQGNIKCSQISIEKGAKIQGNLLIGEPRLEKKETAIED